MRMNDGMGRLAAVCAAAWLMVGNIVHAGEVTRTPPEGFNESLAGLLTPFDKISKEPSNAQDRGGVVLLSEEINSIDRDGRRFIVTHAVYKALNDAGAKQTEQQTLSYRKKEQKVYLVEARTIQPDGSAQSVKPDAAFLKSPQPGADSSIYDDVGEIVILFPNVKSGSITESTVVYEEASFRIPGEFTFGFTWLGAWPVAQMRTVVDLPRDLAGRFKVKTTGEGVPEPEKQDLGERVRYTWSKQDIPAGTAEDNRAPESQVGPALWGTTLADWNAFSAWYAKLLVDRAQLKPSLAAKVEEWTKSAANPREVVDILAGKASNDVRYLGLEFGSANLQPHDCNEVWENQYGDCKDKANLLRAMLAQKGIRSHLVLLNTHHAGKVEKGSPDYRMFNHCILAIEGLSAKGYVLCDPTLPYAKADTLAPTDSDRELLVINEDKAEWVHSPKLDPVEFNYDLDLTLGSQGELSGWLTEKSTGFIAAEQAWYFERLDSPSTRSHLQTILRDLYGGADLTDYEKMHVKDWDGTYRFKIHFAIPARGTNRQLTAAFPSPQMLCPNLGTVKERVTPFYQYAQKISAHVRIKLPGGLSPQEIPQSFQTDTEACSAKASWRFDGGACEADLLIQEHAGSFSPGQFLGYGNAVASLESWLAQPLLLITKADGTTGAVTKRTGDELEDFEKLSSGEAQINLVEKLYPGNSPKRYQALKKTLEYFPADKTTQFIVTVMMANMDRQNHKAYEAATAVQAALKASSKSNLGVELSSWGEYILAMALWDSERSDESAPIFARLADTPGVPMERKAWSRYFAALIYQKEAPKKAATLLLATIDQHTPAQAPGIGLLAQILAKTGRTKELRPVLKKFFNQDTADIPTGINSLQAAIAALTQSQEKEPVTQLIKALDDCAAGSKAAEQVAPLVKQSMDRLNATGDYARIQADLKRFLAAHSPFEFQKVPLPSELKTKADFMRELRSTRSDDLALRYELELLTRFEPDANYSSALIWMAGLILGQQQLNGNLANEELLTKIMELCNQFPQTDEFFYSGRIMKACMQRVRGDLQGSKANFEELLREPKLTEASKSDAIRGLAQTLEYMGDNERALSLYKSIEGNMSVGANRLVMVRPVLLNLQLGHRSEALRILGVLDAAPEIKQFKPSDQYSDLLRLARPGQAEQYWEMSAKWWPAWEELEKKTGLQPLTERPGVLDSGELMALNSAIQAAATRNDRKAFFGLFQKLIYFARWQPIGAFNACRLATSFAPVVGPEFMFSFRNFVLTMLDNFSSDLPWITRNAVQLRAANLIGTGQLEEALAITQKFIADDTTDDWISQEIKRARAYAAISLYRDLQPAAASLESILGSPMLSEGRSRTVWELSQVYKKLGRADDEKALLEKELRDPQIREDQANVRILSKRLDELKYGSTDKLTGLSGLDRKNVTPVPASSSNTSSTRPNSFPPIVFQNIQSGTTQTNRPSGYSSSSATNGARSRHDLLPPVDYSNLRLGTPKPTPDPSIAFSEAVEKWLAKNQPSWFEFAEPKTLDDPRLRDLETLLKETDRQPIEEGAEAEFNFTPAEVVKLSLLVARAPSQPLSLKTFAFAQAFARLLNYCRTWDEARALTASVVEDFDFPESVRTACIWHELTDAASRGNRSEAQRCAADPLAKYFNAVQRDRAQSLLGYAKCDLTSVADIKKECASLSTTQINWGGARAIGLYFKSLLSLGEWEEAKKLNSDIANMSFGPNGPSSPATLQLTHLKLLNAAKINEQIHRALVDVVIKNFPGPVPPEKPAVASIIHNPTHPHMLKAEDMRELLLYRIKTKAIYGDSLKLLGSFIESLSGTPNGREVTHELVQTALKYAGDDPQRATILDRALMISDLDDASERDWLNTQLVPYRSDPSQMETLATIRRLEAIESMRTGHPIDMETAFDNIKSAKGHQPFERLKIQYFVNTGNLPALKRVVDSLSPDELVHPAMIAFTLPALDALGMADEAELVRGAAKRELYRSILSSWVDGDMGHARQAVALAKAMGNPSLPPEWLAALKKTENVEDKLWVCLQEARAKMDWPTVAELSEKGEALPSNRTDWYWAQAEALFKAKKEAEAVKPLETFIARGMGSSDYPAALRLLNQLRPEAVQK